MSIGDIPLPGGDVISRQLEFFWLADASSSMDGSKISTLNQAIRDSIPEILQATSSHPDIRVNMRAIQFNSSASWLVGPTPMPLPQFVWPDLYASGSTATDEAIDLLSMELADDRMPTRGVPPVAILISDGYCNDSSKYEAAINRLKSLNWGKKLVSLAIGIGTAGNDYNETELLKFVSHPEIGVLQADTPEKLLQYVKWASVSASIASSIGKSEAKAGKQQHVILPSSPPQITDSSDLF